jgi:hypothetical protein
MGAWLDRVTEQEGTIHGKAPNQTKSGSAAGRGLEWSAMRFRLGSVTELAAMHKFKQLYGDV